MLKIKSIICLSVAFLGLGLTGTAFAGDFNSGSPAAIGTEAGNWEFNFDAAAGKADNAARNYQYDAGALAAIGTEAGNWEFDFNAPETKASVAARNHVYNPEALTANGTEAGNWEFNVGSADSKSSKAVATDSKKVDADCKC